MFLDHRSLSHTGAFYTSSSPHDSSNNTADNLPATPPPLQHQLQAATKEASPATTHDSSQPRPRSLEADNAMVQQQHAHIEKG